MAAEPRAQHHSAGRRPSSMVAATGLPSAPSSSSRTAPAQVGAAGGPAADIPSMEHSSHRADSSGELKSSARSSSTPYLSSLAPTTTEPSALRSSFGAYGRQQRVTVDLHDRDFELYDDDDDDEDLDDELASRRGEFYEFLSDGGRKAGPSSGKSALLGGSRRRRPRYGISLDEQRAPPPAPISTPTDYMLQSRALSPPAARPLSALSQHALPFTNSPSSASSHKSLPFSNTAGQSAMIPNADNSLPLPETSNTLRKSERRTQVKRSHKLAQVLGQEVLVDDDRLERGSGSSQTTALNPIAAGLNAVAAKIERAKTGGETTLQALRKGNDTDRRSPPIAAMISGGSGSATTTAFNHGSAGRYPAGLTHLNQAGPSQARSPAPTELGAASSKREGTTAESSLHAPILLRRRSRSAQNTHDRVDDSSHLLDDEHSLALSSIQAVRLFQSVTTRL
ncbi:hypothetical protein OC846_000204 [Tilletia horrida]|uniref:Uncharacterized protein n=1 Tax=Tilletia horrida TaxID=155126 RepID=A0AAN6GVE8_9BASI|nr:hypothetical protein OC846_000204 [Tilletia horrida]